MARRKAWTIKKRRQAARKGVVTRRQRQRIITQARTRPETNYAFLIPFSAWLKDSLKRKQRVEALVSLRKSARSVFQVSDIVVGGVVALQAGVVHFSQLGKLVPEVKLAEAIGLPHFFGATTITDMLGAATPRHLVQMARLVRQINLAAVASDRADEIDVVVDTTGHASDSRRREGVAAGYCNGKKQPCLKSGRIVVNGRPRWVRVFRGQSNPEDVQVNQVLALARWLCRQYPHRRVHVGMDTAYASEDHRRRLQQLAQRYPNFRFTFTVQVSHPQSQPFHIVTQAQARPPKQWQRVNSRSRVIERNWRKLYKESSQRTRVIVVASKEDSPPAPRRRRKKRKKPRRSERYYLIATNYSRAEYNARQVFGRHHQRPVVELSIKDGKQSYELDHLPHRKLLENGMFLWLVTLAQLLGILYNQLLLPPATAGALVATVRSDLWRLPGRLLSATHIVLQLVYYRLNWVRRASLAVRRHFGIRIDFAAFNTS